MSRFSIKTAYYKAQGVFTVRAYVVDDISICNGKRGFGFAIASDENLADASDRAIARIQDDFRRDGLAIPTVIYKTGRQARAIVENYLF